MNIAPSFILIYTLTLMLGLLIGCLLNVVIFKLPINLDNEWHSACCELLKKQHYKAVTPLYFCSTCQSPPSLIEIIPILNWFRNKKRCLHCQQKLNMRHPLIEVLTAVLSLALVITLPAEEMLFYALIFTWLLIALAFIDLDTFLLPDKLTLPLLWIGLFSNLSNLFSNLHDAVLGAILGYLVFWVIFYICKILTKQEVLGYGDFKFLAALGAWFGFQAIPMIILIASLSAAIFGVFLIICKKKKERHVIAFGPHIAISGLVFLLSFI